MVEKKKKKTANGQQPDQSLFSGFLCFSSVPSSFLPPPFYGLRTLPYMTRASQPRRFVTYIMRHVFIILTCIGLIHTPGSYT